MRGASSRTTPGTIWPGSASTRRVGQARAVAHDPRLFEQLVDLRRRSPRSRTAASAPTRRTRTRSTIANVVFDRTLALRDMSLRQEFVWALGAHVIEAGGELHRLSTELSFQSRRSQSHRGQRVERAGRRGPARLADVEPRRDARRRLAAGSLAGGTARWHSKRACGRSERRQPRHAVVATRHRHVDARSAHAAARRARPLHPEPRLREAGAERLRPRPHRRRTSAGLRSEQAVQASAGLERDSAGPSTVRVEGYYKTSSTLLVGRLEPEAGAASPSRGATIFRRRWPSACRPIRSSRSTPTNDGRGRAYGFDLFVSRTTAPVDARVRGWASYTWGRARARSRTAASIRSSTTGDTRSPRWRRTAVRALGDRLDHPHGVGFPADAADRLARRGRRTIDDRDGDGIVRRTAAGGR